MKRFVGAVCLAAVFVLQSACTFKKAEFGSQGNPIKLFFSPSVDAKVIDASSKELVAFLEKDTGYKYEVNIPQSYIAVVEAFGSKRADVAAFTTAAYLMANEKYGAQAKLTVIRHGKSTYQGQIITRQDSPIKELKDLEGKRVAFVDAVSGSGYLLPMKLFKDAGVKIGETIFAMKHDSVVSRVYQGEVDAGATFYSPPDEEGIQDARRLVKAQYPDVEQKVRIVKLTDEIVNDPIVFRKDLPEDVKTKVADSMVKFVQSDAGGKSFRALYGVDNLRKASDADYDVVRTLLSKLGVKTTELVETKK